MSLVDVPSALGPEHHRRTATTAAKARTDRPSFQQASHDIGAIGVRAGDRRNRTHQRKHLNGVNACTSSDQMMRWLEGLGPG